MGLLNFNSSNPIANLFKPINQAQPTIDTKAQQGFAMRDALAQKQQPLQTTTNPGGATNPLLRGNQPVSTQPQIQTAQATSSATSPAGVQSQNQSSSGFAPGYQPTVPNGSAGTSYTYGSPITPASPNPSTGAISSPITDAFQQQLQALTQQVSDYTNKPSDYKTAVDKLSGLNELSPAEVQAQTQLNNLLSSEQMGINDQLNRPVAMPYITGQSAALQRQAEAAALPLQQQLALAQAQRQAKVQATQAQVEAYKPQAVTAGTSLVNPATGQELYGGIGGYAGKQALDTFYNLQQTYPDALIQYDPNQSAQANLQAAQKAASQSPSYIQKYQGTRITYNPVTGEQTVYNPKAPVGSSNAGGIFTTPVNPVNAGGKVQTQVATDVLKDITGRQSFAQAGLDAFSSNASSLISDMSKYKINQSGVPIISQLGGLINKGLLGQGEYAAYRNSINTLRNEYAKILSAGAGSAVVTQSAKSEANDAIPDNLTPADLQKVINRVNVEGQNVINSLNNQKNQQGSTVGIPAQSAGGNIITAPDGQQIQIID